MGGVVAACVAAIDSGVAGVVVWDCLRAFADLLRSDDSLWSPEVFIPGVLQHFDIPELLGSVSGPVYWINPLDAMKERFNQCELQSLAATISHQTKVENGNQDTIRANLRELLESADLC
jgi:hypothetical protein